MIKIIKYPARESWESLFRPAQIEKNGLEDKVRNIISRVRKEGDMALLDYSEKYDGIRPSTLKVSEEEIKRAAESVNDDIKKAINLAKDNIEKFHSAQLTEEPVIETTPGINCWRKSIPIEKAGIYVPGGTAPLFSTVLMLAIPARIAGCREIIMCTPPGKDGSVNPLILYTASITGVTGIYKIGGAQAVAAMAFGTESVPRVDKIFGPGNQYVTKAKEMIQMYGIPVDMPAGPSELLIIADKTANPEFIASDLLSQAEHGIDSQVFMLSDNVEIINQVLYETEKQINVLPRLNIAQGALEGSALILFGNINECMDFSNLYAPEHLIIATANPQTAASGVINAGSVFLGNYSCESAGDYATGTNHTLPTNGFARNYSGVSVESFIKKISFQEVTPEGIKNIGPAVELMAGAEMLEGHRNAVTIRLNSLGYE